MCYFKEFILLLLQQVGYNINGWLNKNKDPINESVVGVLGQSKEVLVQGFFYKPPEDPKAGGGKKKGKGGAYQTISATHRVS